MSTKKAVLFGFQTEGGIETIHLTRKWESESKFEASEYREHAETFLKTCHVLFDHGKVKKVGFGAKMIKTLKENKVGFCMKRSSESVASAQ